MVTIAALAMAAVACSSGSGSGAAPSSTAPSGPTRTVRVVADSEVPDGVAAELARQPGIAVASHSSADGATMAQLDAAVDAALAQHPDVLVYSGGTNDLPSGPQVMLDGLTGRLRRWSAQTCVVMAVPVFRYQKGTRAEVEARTSGTRVLERAASDAGAHVASYLDVALAMDDAGEEFFADGELGDLHPGPAAYPRIAAAIAAAVADCP